MKTNPAGPHHDVFRRNMIGSAIAATTIGPSVLLPSTALAGPIANNVADVSLQTYLQAVAANGGVNNLQTLQLLDTYRAGIAQQLSDNRPTNYFWLDPDGRHGVWRDIVASTILAVYFLTPFSISYASLMNWGTGTTASLILATSPLSFGYFAFRFGFQYAIASMIRRRWPTLNPEKAKWIAAIMITNAHGVLMGFGVNQLVQRMAEAWNPTPEGENRRRLLMTPPLNDSPVNYFGKQIMDVLWIIENLVYIQINNTVRINWHPLVPNKTYTYALPAGPIQSYESRVIINYSIRDNITGVTSTGSTIGPQTNPYVYMPVKVITDERGYVYVLSKKSSSGFNLYTTRPYTSTSGEPIWRKLSGQAVDIAAGDTHIWALNAQGLVYVSPLPTTTGDTSWRQVAVPSGITPVAIAVGRAKASATTAVNGTIAAWIRSSSNRYFANTQAGTRTSWQELTAAQVPQRVIDLLKERADTRAAMNDFNYSRLFTANSGSMQL